MHPHLIVCRWFTLGVGAVLLSTAALKLMAIVDSTTGLDRINPLLNIRNEYVLFAAILVESGAGIYLLVSRSDWKCLWLIACLANSLLAYRIALKMVGASPSCGCLGIATQWLPYLGRHEQLISMGMIVAMLAVSILLIWKHPRGRADYGKH